MANNIGWGKGTQNNSNGWGKFQNTIGAASVYAVSYAGETVIEGTSAAFSYSKSSFHQDESDPTPTITGTTGGTFSATPSGLSINTSTGTIDLDNSTIQSYTITYTVSGVSADQTLAVTASPFIANDFSMQFDAASSQYITGNINIPSTFTNLSVSCWVNVDSFASLQNGILSSSTNLGANDYQYGFALEVRNDNKFRFKIGGGGSTTNWLVASDTSNTGQWYHIACIATPTQLEIFVNGVSKGTETNSSLTPSFERFFIGSRFYSNSTANFFDGKIDEVAVWNAALSSDAVQEIYNATANNTGKVLDLNTDSGNYTSSANLQYWNRLGD